MQPSITSLPDVLISQVASYVQDEIQTVDPRCFRSATRIQAQFRAWLIRTHGNPADYAVCSRCGESDGTDLAGIDMCQACTEYFFEVMANGWG